LISSILHQKPLLNYKIIFNAKLLAKQNKVMDALKLLGTISTGEVFLLKQKFLRRVNNLKDATIALTRAMALNYHSYNVFEQAATLAKENEDINAQYNWLKQISLLKPNTTSLPDFLMKIGKHNEAIPLYLNLLKFNPGKIEILRNLYFCYLHQNKRELALNFLKRMYLQAPYIEETSIKIVDCLMKNGKKESAVGFIKNHIRNYPYHKQILKLLIHLDKSPIARSTGGLSAFKTHGTGNSFKTSPAVFILNEIKIKLYKNGSGFKYIHRIVKVVNEKGAEQLGEIELPEEATILSLRTIQKNGNVIYPLSSPEKSSFSMKKLEPGTLLEIEYLLPVYGISGTRGFWGQRFFFSNSILPTVHVKYSIITPKTMKIDIFSTGNLSKPTEKINGQTKETSWSLWSLDKQTTEPRNYDPLTTQQTVRFSAGLTKDSIRGVISELAPSPYFHSFEMEEKVNLICPQGISNCPYRIARWIQKNINQNQNIKIPTKIFHSQEGSRAHLMVEMCRYKNLNCSMTLGRSMRAGVRKPPLPEISQFKVPIVRTPEGSYYDLRHPWLKPGEIPPSLWGSDLLLLSGSKLYDKLPTAKQDKRSISGSLKIMNQGNGFFKLIESATGFLAARRRKGFLSNPFFTSYSTLSTRFLGRYYPGSKLSYLTYDKKENLHKPFKVSYYFSSPAIAPRISNTREIRVIPYPFNLPKKYGIYRKRKTEFLPSYLPVTTLKLRLIPPKGWKFAPETKLEISSKYGYFKRSLTINSDRSALLIIEKVINYKVVSPLEWQKFKEFIKTFDSYESLAIILEKQ
jgi:tetratricopeptide (TPR) repeat protein